MKRAYDVIIYTDGACLGNPGPGGWACILKHSGTRATKKLAGGEPDTTNNRMELQAVIEGLKALKHRCRVKVVTDSQYVRRGMTEWVSKWIANDWRRGSKKGSAPVKNVEYWKRLVALCDQHDVTFEHVRSHAGHPQNEECDRMAVAQSQRFA
ncbi:MAG: ribonuclease HI [Phycisphaerales bacterium]|nr:MAG: ribonuclease HI [Phycisphaerales bacterium]